jgi:hypothetical protein
MAERTIREFSGPSNTNVPTGPTTTVGDKNFELKPIDQYGTSKSVLRQAE